jgi:hypothetical protein
MKYLFICLLTLVGCSTKDVVTKINVAPPDFIKAELVSKCDKPENADVWMELTEHHHFKCTSGFNEGSRVCYGWYIHAKATCLLGGSKATLEYDGPVSFGNSNIHGEEE